MSRTLVDANVFLYALGAEHPYREPCRALVADLAGGRVSGETSVEILQEVVHVRRRRRGAADAAARAREILAWEITVHDLEVDDLERALGLIERHDALPVRDALHAATALNRGIASVISTEPHFDQVAGLHRIDPADLDAVATLQREG